MLDMCRNYANRWRYTYNPAKCSSMLMDRRQRQNTPLIQENPTYTHLGIVQSCSGKYPCNIDDVRQGLRCTYFMLAVGLNPCVMAKLYTACVLPKALFACELWNSVSASNMAKLESTHHKCLKQAQNLPHLTRSDMVTGLQGLKLLFLQTLWKLGPD